MYEYLFSLQAARASRIFLPAVMATFAFNGLVHEYVLGVAAGRILGLAFLSFSDPGLGRRQRPCTFGRAGTEKPWWGIVLTLIFNLATLWCFSHA